MPTYITVHEVAMRLSCSVRTVRRLIASGELPAARVGATDTIRVLVSDVDNLMVPVPVKAAAR